MGVAVRSGILVALVFSGPPLYGMVQAGTIDATGALQRGAIVAVAAAIGVSFIERLVETYNRPSAHQGREMGTSTEAGVSPHENTGQPPKH